MQFWALCWAASVALAGALAAEPPAVEHHQHAEHIKYDEKADHDAEVKKIVGNLAAVAYRFADLEHKLDARKDPGLLTRAGSLKSRVDAVTGGNGCRRKDYFQCGGNDPQCVNNLLVCDGTNDCRNGHDEHKCDLHVKEGDVFVGDVVYDHCTKRKPEKITLTIVSVKTEAYFKGFPKVSATLSMDFENDHAEGHGVLPVRGLYSFARSRLAFAAPEADRLSFFGQFDGSDFDHFVGTIQPEATLKTCAKFYFRRQH